MKLLKDLKSCLQIVVGDRRRRPGVPGRLGKPLPSTQAENEPEGGEGRAGEGRGREGRENVVAQAAAAVRQLSST